MCMVVAAHCVDYRHGLAIHPPVMIPLRSPRIDPPLDLYLYLPPTRTVQYFELAPLPGTLSICLSWFPVSHPCSACPLWALTTPASSLPTCCDGPSLRIHLRCKRSTLSSTRRWTSLSCAAPTFVCTKRPLGTSTDAVSASPMRARKCRRSGSFRDALSASSRA